MTIPIICKMEGVRTEYYLRIRIYSSLERIRNILRYRLKMSVDPDLHFSSFRIRISITVHAQFYINLFINLFSANFYLFFAGFLQEKLRIFLHKTRINSIFFMLSHVKSWTSGSSATLCPREPSPFRSMGEKAWQPYASSTGSWRTTRAQFNSMPTTPVSTTLFL